MTVTDPNFKKISDMTALAAAATNDLIPIIDVSEALDVNKNKTITTANLRKDITNAELAGSITAAKIAGISVDPNADRITFWDDGAGSLAHLAPSTGLQIIDTNISTKDSEIVHNNLSGYDANRHIDHTAVTITAGDGLSGGGTIAANRTIDLDILGIEDLVDPGADRIGFWDDSAGKMDWLIPGTGLTIADKTINAGGMSATEINDGAITLVKMAVESVDSDQYVDGSIDQVHLSVGASKVTNRQGGSATNWSTAGTTNYEVASARIQAGAVLASLAGIVSVTFPIAFASIPTLHISFLSTATGQFHQCANLDETGFDFQVLDAAGARIAPSAQWLAIGAA